MKVLITGANGLLGIYLVNALSQKGHIVVATGKGNSRLQTVAGKFSYEQMDITDTMHVIKVIDTHKPDIIIHAAAITQADECELNKPLCRDTNVTATGFLIDAARQVNAFFIYVSTDFVFDGNHGPYKEEDVPSPVNYYGSSKLAAEKAVQESGLDHAIVRTVLVYGLTPDGTRKNIVTWIKEKLENKEPVKVVDDQLRTPTYVKDLAKGIVLIAEKKAKGIFHISGKDFFTPYQVAVKTAAFLKLDGSLIERVDASVFTQPALRPPRTGFIIDKARNVLGFEPLSFEEGLADMYSK
ncbi:MAG: SDR family oxidoreductase [Chitinophagaceae bacterium]|nr:SDR family oxidoreductase [Chitinophagaceae bacterium]